MFRRRRSNRQTHRHTTQRGPFNFLRHPAFQIGFVIVAAIVVAIIALSGQKNDNTGQPTGSTQPASVSVPDEITADDAYKLYTSNTAYFLDVRERSEWDQIHIPKTTLLPLGQVQALLDKFPKDKPIVVVCSVNACSQQARDILKGAGIPQVTSMKGGLDAWKSKGYPTEP